MILSYKREHNKHKVHVKLIFIVFDFIFKPKKCIVSFSYVRINKTVWKKCIKLFLNEWIVFVSEAKCMFTAWVTEAQMLCWFMLL